MNALTILIPIALPILGGFILIPLKPESEGRRRALCMSVTVATTVAVWLVLLWAERSPATVYSFTRGFSISFGIDGASALFAGMVSIMWPIVMPYAFEYMRDAHRKNAFFAFYVMTYGVTLGVAFAANMTTLYVFYEMLSLVTLPLVTHYGDHESMYAGRKYAAYTIGGASLAFFAVIMATLHGADGFIYSGALADQSRRNMLLLAYACGFFGFGVKAAIFPLHDWLPTASAAPTPVTALLHAVAVVNSGVFAVMRLTYYTYGTEFLIGTYAQYMGIAVSAFTLLFAAVMAVRERHFKRRLAWSTVSNLSYMLFGLTLMTADGFVGGMSHMLFHGIIKMALFLCAGAFMHVTGKNYIYEINGIGRKMPITFACYTISALSLTGIPMLCGFVSKWQLLQAGVAQGSVWAIVGVICLIVSAFLCAIYTLTVCVRAYFPISGTDRYSGTALREARPAMTIPICVFTVIDVILGVNPEWVMRFIAALTGG